MTVYFIQRSSDNCIKIGKTRCAIEKRFKEIWYGENMCNTEPKKLTLLGTIDGYTETEHELHRIFGDLRYDREWFLPGEKLIDFISSKANTSIRFSLQKSRCKGTTNRGYKCQEYIEFGQDYCKKHIGQDSRTKDRLVTYCQRQGVNQSD